MTQAILLTIQSVLLMVAVVLVLRTAKWLNEIEKQIFFDFSTLLRAYRDTLIGVIEKSEDGMTSKKTKREEGKS